MTIMNAANIAYSPQRVSGVPSAASVMETIMATTMPARSTSSANAAVATVIMIAEKAADMIKTGARISA